MNARVLARSASLLVSLAGALQGGAAIAQAATGNIVMARLAAPSGAADPAGRWAGDPRGHAIGGVRSLADDARLAVPMTGSHSRQGSHGMRGQGHG